MGNRKALRPDLPASEFCGEGKIFQKLRAVPSGNPQAAYVQVEVFNLDAFPGLVVPIEEKTIGDKKIVGCQGKACLFTLLPFFEIERAIAVPRNGDPGALQSDPLDPDLLVEQREKSDLKACLLSRGDVHLTIPDVHIIKPDMQVPEESDSQSAANADFQPQGFRGSPLQS
ncbi:MAG: hypothetical protein ABFD70_11175 [Syntrophaceae bacterium]